MRYIFVFCFLISSCLNYAQTQEELNEEGLVRYAQADYEGAIDKFDESIVEPEL